MTNQGIIDIFMLIITMLLWGTTPLFEKIGLKHTEPLMGVFIRSLAITVILFVIYLFSGRLNEFTKVPPMGYVLFSASGIMAGLIAMWTYFYLLKAGMASKIVPIAAAYPLITAILSMVILKEEVNMQRIVGVILTIIGVVLIKQS